eukprot:366503-Chlamydomonas_euryale.AAC.18
MRAPHHDPPAPQDINPLPYPMTVLNCVAWIVYATVVKDPFIAPPNVIGAVGGVWFTLTALPLCVRKVSSWVLAVGGLGGWVGAREGGC